MKHYSKKQFERSLVIFTDGSSLGNPGPGGYGCVIVFQPLDEVVELGGNKSQTTNNEMELSAVIAALSHAVFSTTDVELFTDSSYVIQGITKWVHAWEKNGWKTKTKTAVANQKLWEILIGLVRDREKKSKITWHHIPGHVGVIGNERCDEIATSYAMGKPGTLFRGKLSNYGANILGFSIDETLAVEKGEKRARSTTKAYSYLSLIDRVPGRHETWESCEKRVKGKSAKFKKTLSKYDEEKILEEWGINPDNVVNFS